jgi:hypothetical protein
MGSWLRQTVDSELFEYNSAEACLVWMAELEFVKYIILFTD